MLNSEKNKRKKQCTKGQTNWQENHRHWLRMRQSEWLSVLRWPRRTVVVKSRFRLALLTSTFIKVHVERFKWPRKTMYNLLKWCTVRCLSDEQSKLKRRGKYERSSFRRTDRHKRVKSQKDWQSNQLRLICVRLGQIKRKTAAFNIEQSTTHGQRWPDGNEIGQRAKEKWLSTTASTSAMHLVQSFSEDEDEKEKLTTIWRRASKQKKKRKIGEK